MLCFLKSSALAKNAVLVRFDQVQFSFRALLLETYLL
jgi:hypothetical protein